MKNYNKNCVVQTQKVHYQIPNGVKQKRIRRGNPLKEKTKVKIKFNSSAAFGIAATLCQDTLSPMTKVGFIGLFILAAFDVEMEKD